MVSVHYYSWMWLKLNEYPVTHLHIMMWIYTVISQLYSRQDMQKKKGKVQIQNVDEIF